MIEPHYELFLYYSRTDVEAVQELAALISDLGIRVWFDLWELIPGQESKSALMSAMQQSAFIGICIGRRRSGRLDQQGLESLLALRHLTPPRELIPILLPNATPSSIPTLLSNIPYVDFSAGLSDLQALKTLLALLRKDDTHSQATLEREVGDLLRSKGDFQGALKQYQSALATVQMEEDEKSQMLIASLYTRIAKVQQETDDFQAAQQSIARAILIRRNIYGGNHPTVARDLNILGGILAHLGKWDGALTCYEQARTIYTTMFGATSSDVADTIGNMGSVLRDQGKLADAQQAFQQAVAIHEAVLGPEHFKVATDYNNLGGVLRDLGRVEEAKNAFQHAHTLFVSQFGVEHPFSRLVEQNLSTLLLITDSGREKYQKAAESIEGSLAQAIQLGQSEKVINLLANLGAVADKQENYQTAKAYLDEALQLAQQIGHQENISYLLTNVGTIEMNLGRDGEAERHFLEGLKLAREMGYQENITVLLSNLGTLYYRQKKYQLAIANLKAGLDLAREMGHQENICTLLTKLGIITHEMKEYLLAKDYFQQAFVIAQQLNNNETSSFLTTQLQDLPQELR